TCPPSQTRSSCDTRRQGSLLFLLGIHRTSESAILFPFPRCHTTTSLKDNQPPPVAGGGLEPPISGLCTRCLDHLAYPALLRLRPHPRDHFAIDSLRRTL